MENNTENKTEQKEIRDLRQYVYDQGTKIEIDGFLLTDLIHLLENLLKDEVKSETKFKYNYVNEKGAVLKSPKKEDIESGKVKKIVDFKRTIFEPTLEHSITEKGLAYAELKNFLEGIHYNNIQSGVAVSYEEMANKLRQPAPAMENLNA